MKFSAAFAAALIAVMSESTDARLFFKRQNQQPPQQQQPNAAVPNQKSIWSLMQNSTELSIFAQQAAKFPELTGLMSGNASAYRGQPVQSLTVFAPINQAWTALPDQLRNALVNAPSLEELQQRLPPPADQRMPPQQGRQGINETVSEFRQATSLEEALLAYHMHNGTLDVQQYFAGAMASVKQQPDEYSATVNTTVSSLLAPFNLTIWQQAVMDPSQQQQPSIGQLLPGVGAQYFVNTTDSHVNDARILGGVRAANGILYLVDSVVSPLWYLNITLQNLPKDLTLPQLVQAMRA